VRSQVNLQPKQDTAEFTDESEELESSDIGALSTVSSNDYASIVKTYTNRKGELSYELLNKTLIQAANSNPFITTMVSQGASLEEIVDHVVKVNFEAVTGNRQLSTAEVQSIVGLLDEVSPRSVFRELGDEIRKMISNRRS